MTAERYLDNAICAYLDGLTFEQFWDNKENFALARSLSIQPEQVWEMAQYVVDYLKSTWEEAVVDSTVSN